MKKILFISLSVLIVSMGFAQKSQTQYDGILVGGLDYRKGDKSIGEQELIFKEGFGMDKKVKSFSYNTDVSLIKKFLIQNPKVPIFLFSAGSKFVLKLVEDVNVDKKLLFVIHPFTQSEDINQLVLEAVRRGLLEENIYVGSYSGVGSNLKLNTTKTPNSISHIDALRYVGRNLN